MRRIILVAAVMFLAGCGGQQAEQEATVERTVVETVEVTEERTMPEVPLQDYEVVEQTDHPIEGSGFTRTDYLIYATHDRDLQQIADKLREDGGHDMVQLVAINGPGGDPVGRAYSYASPEVEQAAATEVDQVVDDLIREQCQTWDTETLGEPPPEWNCEQFQ